MKITFDAKQFLDDNWGSPEKLLKFLENYDATDLQLQSVRAWWRRKSIPAEHLPVLLALLEVETGKPVSVMNWLKQ